MPKLMFDQIERQIVNSESKTLLAAILRFYIARKRMEVEFIKAVMGLFAKAFKCASNIKKWIK